jgi:hypothetical protein
MPTAAYVKGWGGGASEDMYFDYFFTFLLKPMLLATAECVSNLMYFTLVRSRFVRLESKAGKKNP